MQKENVSNLYIWINYALQDVIWGVGIDCLRKFEQSFRIQVLKNVLNSSCFYF